jgi:hypothetical protein
VHRHSVKYPLAVLATCAVVLLVGCSGSGGASAVVPSLSQSAAGAQGDGGEGNGGSGAARASALHAAAQCIRQHGIPGYADPVLTPGGQVYSDSRSIQDASQSVFAAVLQACATLLTQANLNPGREPPAPPQLVRAGVRAAACLRAHGLPNIQDPTARSPYTPGHGFGMTRSEMPAGGKASPLWQHARQACDVQVTAEIQASTLASLGNDG